MADEKEYAPMNIVQHTSKIKFKSYVFSVVTQEWMGTNNNGSLEGMLKKIAEVNVYLKSKNSPSSQEFHAIHDQISLRSKRETVPDSIENYAILLHRKMKKEIEQEIKTNPKAYFKGIESVVDEYRKDKF